MPDLAGDVQPVALSPDGKFAWWDGSWRPLDLRELSPGGQWVMLGGQWRPVAAPAVSQPTSDPAESEAVHASHGPAQLPQQVYPPGFAPAQQNYAPGPYMPGGYPPNGGPDGSTNGLAIASLVLGIIWLGGLGSLLAVIFGHVSRGQSKRAQRGTSGLATAGLVLGYIGLAFIAVFGIVLLTAVDKTNASRGYEASMKSDLRTVAQEIESQNVDNQDYTKVTFGTGTASAGTSLSGNYQSVGTDTVSLSEGNTVTLVGASASAFCLSATNSHTDGVTWYYDSSQGGLSLVPCTEGNP